DLYLSARVRQSALSSSKAVRPIRSYHSDCAKALPLSFAAELLPVPCAAEPLPGLPRSICSLTRARVFVSDAVWIDQCRSDVDSQFSALHCIDVFRARCLLKIVRQTRWSAR